MDTLYCIPAFLLTPGFTITRLKIIDGVWVENADRKLGLFVKNQVDDLPVQLLFSITHVISILKAEYESALEARVVDEGGVYVPPRFLDVEALAKQAVVGLSLSSGVSFTFRGFFTVSRTGVQGHYTYKNRAYSHGRESRVSDHMRYAGVPDSGNVEVNSSELKKIVRLIDPYYRSGIYRVDRISMALGHYFEALLSLSPVHTFVGFAMVLESLLSTGSAEVTHTLSERVALLLDSIPVYREQRYREVKALYAIRSKLVHGSSYLKKGRVTTESLFMSARNQNIPESKLEQMKSVAIQTLNKVLGDQELFASLSGPGSESATDKKVDAYFLKRLMGEISSST